MIAVTGATGHLGRLVIDGLLKTLPASEIIAVVRTPEKAADLAALGVQVRAGDYTQPETLRPALAGADKVLLISSSDLSAGSDARAAQHQAVIDAAQAEGVSLLAYTSILRADTSPLALARVHKATENAIRQSSVPFVFLRNGWYLENQTEALAPAIEHGAIIGAAGEGKFASAGRTDYAAAAVAVLTLPGQENKIYELAGDTPYTLTELAAEVAQQSGKPVAYQNLPPAEYQKALEGFGLPAPLAEMLVDADAGAANGELDGSSAEMRSLIGRPTMTLAEAVQAAVK